jgi:hypothetical protein
MSDVTMLGFAWYHAVFGVGLIGTIVFYVMLRRSQY